jgi:hypothetical protein
MKHKNINYDLVVYKWIEDSLFNQDMIPKKITFHADLFKSDNEILVETFSSNIIENIADDVICFLASVSKEKKRGVSIDRLTTIHMIDSHDPLNQGFIKQPLFLDEFRKLKKALIKSWQHRFGYINLCL